MALIVERADVWAASIKDQPGGLGAILADLRDAGADLDFVIARRAPDKPGTGVVFVTPLQGDAEVAAAADAGFNVSASLHSVRVEGENERGLAAVLAQKIGAAGINLRGMSASVIGTKFIMYIAVDSEEDTSKIMNLLKEE